MHCKTQQRCPIRASRTNKNSNSLVFWRFFSITWMDQEKSVIDFRKTRIKSLFRYVLCYVKCLFSQFSCIYFPLNILLICWQNPNKLNRGRIVTCYIHLIFRALYSGGLDLISCCCSGLQAHVLLTCARVQGRRGKMAGCQFRMCRCATNASERYIERKQKNKM